MFVITRVVSHVCYYRCGIMFVITDLVVSHVITGVVSHVITGVVSCLLLQTLWYFMLITGVVSHVIIQVWYLMLVITGVVSPGLV